MALGADGPGYYNARRAIELLKENEKKNKKVVISKSQKKPSTPTKNKYSKRKK